jgi:hypothetical protein
MQTRFYTAAELSNEAYHLEDGISNSGLKLIGKKSPFHYYGQNLDPLRPARASSYAMMIGTAIHAATLEPDKFNSEYVIGDFNARNAKGFKAWSAEQKKNILLTHELRNVQSMHKALYNDPTVASLLRDAYQFEYSAFSRDPITGVTCRVRADLVTNGGYIIDLKKCQDASDQGVKKAIYDYGYYHQDAFYTDVWTWVTGEPPAGFAFIFVEEVFPHAVSLVILHENDRDRGRMEYRKNLNTYADCLDSGIWPGYGTGAREIELAQWQRRNIDIKLGEYEYE